MHLFTMCFPYINILWYSFLCQQGKSKSTFNKNNVFTLEDVFILTKNYKKVQWELLDTSKHNKSPISKKVMINYSYIYLTL